MIIFNWKLTVEFFLELCGCDGCELENWMIIKTFLDGIETKDCASKHQVDGG